MSEPAEIPKDGDRIIAASRRPDGTLRKQVRIRAGYTPQDEVAVYQSKGALFKQGPSVPPGFDPDDATTKPKTKAAKKNEKRKEKKQQASSSGSHISGQSTPSGDPKIEAVPQGKAASAGPEAMSGKVISGIVEEFNLLAVSHPPKGAPLEKDKSSSKADLEKTLRALRKKIRLSESLQASSSHLASLTPEQVEKLSKLPAWRRELQELESGLVAVNL